MARIDKVRIFGSQAGTTYPTISDRELCWSEAIPGQIIIGKISDSGATYDTIGRRVTAAAGTPVGNVTPLNSGEIYINTSNNDVYIAYGVTNTSWSQVNGAGSGDALVSGTLAQFAATTSAELAGVITNETGSGALVFATSPALVTPDLGTPSALTLTNATGLPLTTGVTGVLPVANYATGTPDGTKFVRDDGTLVTPTGSGDVNGPGTATADAIVLFNGTGGKTIKDSTYTITATGAALLDDATVGDQRTTLGLVIGTNVQAYNSALTGTTGTYTTANATTLGTALQPGDIGATVQAQSAVLDATTASFLVADETKLDFISATGAINLDHISVTQAVDLDAIETRVNELDASIVLMGTWDASVGTFPGAGTINAGESWIVSTGGTVNGEVFVANDRLLCILDDTANANASTTTYAGNWHKLDYTDQVLSVASKTGAVTLDTADTIVAANNVLLGNDNGTTQGAQELTAAEAKTLLAISNTDVSGLGALATKATIDSAGLIDNGVVSVAKLANGVDGELITWSATGVATTVAVGTATEVLTSNGVGAAPTFQTAPVSNANHTGDVTGDTALTIAADAVTYAKMQNAAAQYVMLGNVGAADSIIAELTPAQMLTALSSGGTSTANYIIKVNGTGNGITYQDGVDGGTWT